MTRKKKRIDMSTQPQPKRGGPPIETSPLVEVRNSPVHGRGVFACARIKKGTRVIEYLGDRVSHAAADARYEDHDESDNHTFLFIVDKQTVIDAGVHGNDARFINHQCSGNCESIIENRRVFIDAVRDIEPGQELGYDYEIGRDKDDPPNVDEIYACRCGSPQCRGTMLWPPRKTVLKSESKAEAEGQAPPEDAARSRSQEPSPAGRTSEGTYTPPRLIEQLAERGFGVVEDFVDAGLLLELHDRCIELHAAGALRAARIGRGPNERLVPEVRGDFISWLTHPERNAEQRLLAQLDELRMTLNRELMAGARGLPGTLRAVSGRAPRTRGISTGWSVRTCAQYRPWSISTRTGFRRMAASCASTDPAARSPKSCRSAADWSRSSPTASSTKYFRRGASA